MNAPSPSPCTQNQIGQYLMDEMIRVAECFPQTAITAADAFLEATAPAIPDAAPFYTNDAVQDCEWWASTASDRMLSAMLAACLKQAALIGIQSPKARKRALVALWNTMDATDRAQFLEFVDPGAKAKA